MDELERWFDHIADEVGVEMGNEAQDKQVREFVQSAMWYKAMYNELRSGDKPLPDKTACDITCAHIQMLGDMASRREDR